jgi:acetyltransferase-like isoleucine patch superfamily enzyme
LGENVLFQPLKLPNEPQLIKIHNNVKIAEGVTFYTHDAINGMFAVMDNKSYVLHGNCIEIFDNVFIGGKAVVAGNVKIGPNAIIGAGTVVTKDVPEGVVVAGNPASIVGKFDDFKEKRLNCDATKKVYDPSLRADELWKQFYIKKNVTS